MRHAQGRCRSTRCQVGADSSGQVGDAGRVAGVVAGTGGRLEHVGTFEEKLHTRTLLPCAHGVPKNFVRQAGHTHHLASRVGSVDGSMEKNSRHRPHCRGAGPSGRSDSLWLIGDWAVVSCPMLGSSILSPEAGTLGLSVSHPDRTPRWSIEWTEGRGGLRSRARSSPRCAPSPGQPGRPASRRRGGRVGGGCRRGGNSAKSSVVASSTWRTARSTASSVRDEGDWTPLTLRTYWRAAASISCDVASGCSPRRVVMLRHMMMRLRGLGPSLPPFVSGWLRTLP